MLPTNRFKQHWDFIQVVNLVYVSLAVPFRVGFRNPPSVGDPFFVIDLVVDALFIADVILHFFASRADPMTGFPVTNKRRIAALYLRGWFTLDLVSALPFTLLVDYDYASNWDRRTGDYAGIKILQYVRLLKLLKLLRVFRMREMVVRYTEIVPSLKNILNAYDYTKLLLAVLLLGHFVACLYYFIGTMHSDCTADGHFVAADQPSWLLAHFGEDAINSTSYYDRYVASTYWSFTTLTTVGYGDISATNTDEKIYCIFGMIAGTAVFATVTGTLAERATANNMATVEGETRMNRVVTYLKMRKVPQDLLFRVGEPRLCTSLHRPLL